ncbi:transcriptional repressor, partial [Xanthomonas euvesicatoria]|uniref:transcriptional repressor n=1 Tax=Xanthomonas euvesicatoria TaxID=456327 RepID=UPI0026E2D045
MTKHTHAPDLACTAPHHHVDDANGFVRAVERACSERGLRLTPIRANVLRLIADAGKPVKAYELLDWVREGKGVGAAAPPPGFRARGLVMGNRFVHKLESVNGFVAGHPPHSP